MLPKVGDLKVDNLLSQFSQMYRNENYISEQILPVLPVKEKSGKYAKYGKENLRSYSDQIYRAPGTRAHTVDYSVSQGSYLCSEKSLEKIVPWEMYKNYDDPYDPERDATEVVMDNIWVNQELALATAMGNTAIITQNVTLSGTDKWTDKTNSDPIGDIRTAMQTVKNATGQRPNVIVFCEDAFEALKDHPDIREQMKYTNGGQPSDDQLSAWVKSYFRVSEVLIGDAVHNSADEGQSDSLGAIWTGNVWCLYRNAKPTLMKATFGATLSDEVRVVDVRDDKDIKSNIVRVSYSYDQNIFDASLCYLIKSVV